MHGTAKDTLKNCVIRVNYPKGVGISFREPLVPLTKFEKEKSLKKKRKKQAAFEKQFVK